jgi:hypothetical protein
MRHSTLNVKLTLRRYLLYWCCTCAVSLSFNLGANTMTSAQLPTPARAARSAFRAGRLTILTLRGSTHSPSGAVLVAGFATLENAARYATIWAGRLDHPKGVAVRPGPSVCRAAYYVSIPVDAPAPVRPAELPLGWLAAKCPRSPSGFGLVADARGGLRILSALLKSLSALHN